MAARVTKKRNTTSGKGSTTGKAKQQKAKTPNRKKPEPPKTPQVVEAEQISPITGLTPSQLRAAEYLSLGFAPKVAASKVGVTLTTVSNWRKLKAFTDAIKFLREGGADRVIAELHDLKSAEEILETAAVRAAERVTEIMETADSDQTQLRAAESVLDRTGRHRKTEVHKHIVLVETSALDLIESTKKLLIPEADFTVEEEPND